MRLDAPASSAGGLARASLGVILAIGTVGLAAAGRVMAENNERPDVWALMIVLTLLPYALAAWISWAAWGRRRVVLVLLGLWSVGGALTLGSLADALWLTPRFLSDLVVLVLPIVQIPVVLIAGLLVRGVARRMHA